MNKAEIRETLTQVSPSVNWAEVADDTPMEDAGLDSLDKANLIMEIENKASTSIDDSFYDEINTINDIHAFLQKK